MNRLVVATEDELSEAVALRLVAEVQPALVVTRTLRRNGFGYLRSKITNWCQVAQYQPVFLLTDLDKLACPIMLLQQWCGALTLPADLLLRVAVREVEAWLLADHSAMRELLNLGEKGKLPPTPDTLPDPKQTLLNLAAKYAPRDVRQDLVHPAGSMASQGIGYNSRLVSWVHSCWQPEQAALRSPSLSKARYRLQELATRHVTA